MLAAAELERRNRELTLVGQLAEYLQAVSSSDEVFDVAASYGRNCSRISLAGSSCRTSPEASWK